MTKELWALRKLNLNDEVIDGLSSKPTKIHHSKYWNIIGIAIFPLFSTFLILNGTFSILHLGTILMAILLVVLGFILSIKQRL